VWKKDKKKVNKRKKRGIEPLLSPWGIYAKLIILEWRKKWPDK
jgi:hypothetical protein